jgi:hypothetical protein
MNKQLAGLVLLAAVAAGCGTTTSTATVGSPGSSSPSAGATPAGSPDPLKTQTAPVGSVRVLPTTATPLPPSDKPVSLPWRFIRLADGGTKVEISLLYGGCTALNYVQVLQQSSAVEITVWGTEPISSKTICPALEAVVSGTVTLSAPLGSRQLLHGLVALSHGFTPQ